MRHVSQFRDRHGHTRWRFRRLGFSAYFRNAPGTPGFSEEYDRFMQSERKAKEPLPPLPIIPLLRQLPPTAERGAEYVYFVEAENTLVKIGHTRNIRERFKKLHTGAAGQLTLLGLARGGRDLEALLHRTFASQRVTGEWFLPSPELRELARRTRGEQWLTV